MADPNTEKGIIGEKYVQNLAENTFFNYWCFPNPTDELGDKKEICDLIIHFNNTLILICIKNYEFKGLYSRYFRKVIEKDVRQLYGAERKIFSNSSIQIKCSNGKQAVLEKDKINNVYRIIIHLGDHVCFYPFNRITKEEKFVHVFDQTSFHNLIHYLDTIKDFIQYIEEREIAFGDKQVLVMPGEDPEWDEETGKQYFEFNFERNDNFIEIQISGSESDLLARYIENQRKFDEAIYSKKYHMIHIDIDGEWEKFLKREEVKGKLKEDKISYFIDDYIKNQLLPINSSLAINYAQILSSLNRFERRILSKHFFDFIKEMSDKEDTLARRFGDLSGFGIIYLVLPAYMNNDTVARLSTIFIDAYSYHTKYQFMDIILFSFSKKDGSIGLDIRQNIKPFDEKYIEDIKHNMKVLSIFKDYRQTEYSEKEFPDD